MRAAIAIGSNSTRMLCAEKRRGVLTDIVRGREETRLFLGLDANGCILPERIESTAQAVKRLQAMALAHGAEGEIALLATSATRDAGNAAALAERVWQLTGLSLRVISGEEEACLAYRAAAGLGRHMVMDIGGGSTEITVGDKGRVLWAGSAQMGASRLMKARPIRGEADVRASLRMAREALLPLVEQAKRYALPDGLTGLGGSCTTMAAMLLGREAHGEEIEGWPVTLEDARRFLALLAPMTEEERRRVPGLPASRAAHMPSGLCILVTALELMGKSLFRVSIRTNLDGYLLSQPDEE